MLAYHYHDGLNKAGLVYWFLLPVYLGGMYFINGRDFDAGQLQGRF